MIFSSFEFIIFFFPVFFLIYYLLPKKIKNYYILAASFFFCAWGGGLTSVTVLIISIIFNYVLGLRIAEFDKKSISRRIVLGIDIIFNISLLFVFKYFNFTIDLLKPLFFEMDKPAWINDIALPLGISFFTFKGISYAIDVYRGNEICAETNIGSFGMYMAFFPQLVAGPIVRFPTMKKNLSERTVTPSGFSRGLMRFIIGFNKKILLADIFVATSDLAFASAPESVCFAWLGAFCYTLQIYYDFSGYSDMAIGLAAMLGFYTPENFDYPYISQTVTEFWRRWHISLGSWFRDYVYFPLGGSRVKRKSRMIFNLFVVWILTGIWHGANWTFIVWGLVYGILISFEKVLKIPSRIKQKKALPKVLYRVFTMLMVVLGWVLFRSSTMGEALQYLKTMFGFAGKQFVDGMFEFYLVNNRVFIAIGILFSMPVWPWMKEKIIAKAPTAQKSLTIAFDFAQVLLFVCSISSLVINTHNPFVYINF